MDLRVLKTKKNIREAFLELRKNRSLDDIKVNALCEKAMVNKTTFYNHYQDIYELSEELEAEVLDDFFVSFTNIDKMLTDANSFISGMHLALERNNDMLRILLRTNWMSLLDASKSE